MRTATGILCLSFLVLAGCRGLILREDDSGLETTGKVVARVLLCPVTICLSELEISETRQREIRAWKEQEYRHWLSTLSPEQRAEEYALERARIQAAGQALMGLGLGGPFRTTPVRPPVPAYQPQSNPRTCTYNAIGQTLYQNCY